MEFFNAQFARAMLAARSGGDGNASSSEDGVAATAGARAAPAPAPPLPHKCPGFTRPGRTPTWAFVDMFDLTFPFHYDNLWSDGGHYGRYNMFDDTTRERGRSDHVDLMMIHVILNGLCPLPA